jgi:cellulose synthase (UDP-forming)
VLLTSLAPTLLIAGVFLLLFGFQQRGMRFRPDPSNPKLRMVLFVVLGVLLLRYLHWRLTETLTPFAWSLEGIWPYFFLFFELSSLLMLSVTYLTLSRRTDRTQEVNDSLHLLDGPPLKVAMLIPTYNEPKGVLERTILGALSQDYAGTRVWVLDDGRRDWLREYCDYAGVGYVCRNDNVGAKAGNMNHGLAAIRAEGYEPDFMAVLDADFVATPDFVRRCLALHMKYPDVGIVQTPQHFFNPDPVQMNLVLTGVAPDEQRFFFDELMPSKDGWGTAFCCGTSSVIRTAAVDAIDGFPMDSVTEDMLMSLRMREAGYRTIYLNEPLTTGLAPEGLGEYIVQRHRWCLGFMQILRDHYNPFSRRHNLNLIDRIHLLDTFMYWGLSFPTRYIFLLAPSIYWITGWLVIDARLEDILYFLAPWLVAHMTIMTWMSRGALQPVLNDVTQLLIVPASIHATLTGLFSRAKHKFKVTPKGLLEDKITVDWQAMRPVLILGGINLLGMLLATMPTVQPDLPYEPRMVNLFWLVINFFILAIAALSCIELPRRREQERFAYMAPEMSQLVANDRSHTARVAELSLTGCSLTVLTDDLDTEALLGAEGELVFGPDERIRIKLVRSLHGSDEAAYGGRFIDPTLEQQLILTRHIYGKGTARVTFQSGTFHLLGEIFQRLVRPTSRS